MKCSNCGKEYDDSFTYCPYCAEPNTVEKTKQSETCEKPRDKKDDSSIILWAVLLMIDVIVGYQVFTSDYVKTAKGFIIAFIAIAIPFVGIISHLSNKDRKAGYIPKRKNLEYCPRCKSKNLKYYRKGYDWKKGFWYRFFELDDGFLAGMSSNHTMCHCRDCGNTWETDYDYREL